MDNIKKAVCPFCGQIITKENSTSKEHILPESLGNKNPDAILPKGIICDNCNNYFAREIEKDFLDIKTIKLLRSYVRIRTKKRKIPPVDVLVCGDKAKVEFSYGDIIMKCDASTISKFFKEKPKMIFTKAEDMEDFKNSYTVSRFLAKIFAEYTISVCLENNINCNDFSKYPEFQELFHYVRYGSKNRNLFKYSVTIYRSLSEAISDDLISSISTFTENNILCMQFTLYTLKFILYFGKII
ncbi:MAG: HNH endonuclease [Bacilli bacterium]